MFGLMHVGKRRSRLAFSLSWLRALPTVAVRAHPRANLH
jgi:hypothetical protein